MRAVKVLAAGVILAFCLSLLPLKASAYPGGLLDRKPGTSSSGSTVLSMTDNNLSTGTTIGYGNQYVAWVLDEPYNITRLQWRFSSASVTLSIRGYNANNVQVGRYDVGSQPANRERSQEVEWPSVKSVRIYNASSNFNMSIQEFDVWGNLGPPNAPINLIANDNGAGSVTLNWEAVPGVDGYNVYRDGTKLNTSLITTTSYNATGLVDNVTYRWQVSAIRDDMESDLSSAVTTHRDTLPPGKPMGLKAEAKDTQVLLKWTANPANDGVIGYHVYKDGALITTEPIAATQYLVTSLINGTSYNFSVSALDRADNESVRSDVVSVSPVDLTPPDTPSNFRMQAGDQKLILTWDPNTEPDLQGYRLYDGSSHLATIPKSQTQYTVSGLTNGKQYTYRLLAYDMSGNASPYATATGSPADTTPPARPLNLSGAAGNKIVNLFWSANSDPDLMGYYIYMNGTKLNVPVNKDIYRSIGSLTNGEEYEFAISAVDYSGNESPRSSPIKLTPDINADSTPPATPTGLTVVGERNTIVANWDPNTEPDLIGYFIYLDGQRVNYSPLSSSTYRIPNLTLGRSYSVSVTAMDNSGNESPRSDPISVHIDVIPMPTNLKARHASSGVILTWKGTTPPPEKYYIYRNGINLGEVGPNANEFLDDSVAPEHAYMYQVSAVRDTVESDRAQTSLYYSVKNPPLSIGDVELPFGVGGMLETSINFLKHYGGWILLYLGVMFVFALISPAQQAVKQTTKKSSGGKRKQAGSKKDKVSAGKTPRERAGKTSQKAEGVKVAGAAKEPKQRSRPKGDRSHLVKTQVNYQRNGKTYTRTVYKKPENYTQGKVYTSESFRKGR